MEDLGKKLENTEKNDGPKLTKPKKRLKIGKIAIFAAIVVVVVAAITWLAISVATRPLNITKIETTNAISSRVVDYEAKNTFKDQEPIMLHFEFTGAAVGSKVDYEIKNAESSRVKSGSTNILRDEERSPADGQRYISIVSTTPTALPVGNYQVELSVSGRPVGNVGFSIE
ncbi:MAG: hypothetical protein LBL08_02655 [Candidatus Nomurabacteria bacterium]|nr:hypothetical protein [Candidatus Nomurabacteria bacterium]